MRLIFAVFMTGVFLFISYALLWPVPIDPAAWTPPPAPALEGVYAVNERLAEVERLGEGVGVGPEDVGLDAAGRVYAGFNDGRVVRWSADLGSWEVLADTGGRPAGFELDADGNLVLAETTRGLLSIAQDGTVSVLSTEADGLAYGLADDVDIADDGVIYFTDASWKFGVGRGVMLDLLEHRPNGRLLAYDPASGDSRTLLDDLYFANGVAVSPDQSFVLVCETWAYRVRRYWLTGPKAGESDVFIGNLPGFPDGVSSNGRDTFWVALVTPRNPELDELLPSPFRRRLMLRLPFLLPSEQRAHSFILGLDAEGHVMHNLQDPGAKLPFITSICEHGGALYLGSSRAPCFGRLAHVPRPSPAVQTLAEP